MRQKDQQLVKDALHNLVLMNQAMLELLRQLDLYLGEEKDS